MVNQSTADPDQSDAVKNPGGNGVNLGMRMIPLDLLIHSKTNPRKRIDPQAQKELVASIREHGVAQPVLVRPAFHDRKTKAEIIGSYEIICGERRFRAAKEAGLKEIPAMIAEKDDKAVLEIQVIENMQRSDLHPLEEAEGYELLMKEYGYAGAEQIAAKVGKSKAYVYARMKLCDLTSGTRRLFYDGQLTASTALLIARVPREMQDQAAKEITDSKWGSERVLSYRKAAEHIHKNYMLFLKEATFPKNDETLVAKAGPCTTCPKRVGNQADLFPDVKSADVCTDPKCFEVKRNAFFQRQMDRAKKANENVLSADTCKRIFHEGGGIAYNADYVDLGDQCYSSGKSSTYKDLLKKSKKFKPSLAVDPQGRIREVGRKADIEKALKESGIKTNGAIDKSSKEDAERIKLSRFRNLAMRTIVAKLVAAFRRDKNQSFWPLLAKKMLKEAGIDARHLIALRINNKSKVGEAWDITDKYYKELDATDCPAFAFELFISRKVASYSSGYDDVIIDFCKHYGIDIKAIEAEVKQAREKDKEVKK